MIGTLFHKSKNVLVGEANQNHAIYELDFIRFRFWEKNRKRQKSKEKEKC